MHVDVYLHVDDALTARLDKIIESLTRLENQMSAESDAIAALTAQVQQQTTVEASAITLINGLAAQLAAAGTDPAKLAALTQQLQASAAPLSAAITANTPSATPPATTVTGSAGA